MLQQFVIDNIGPIITVASFAATLILLSCLEE